MALSKKKKITIGVIAVAVVAVGARLVLGGQSTEQYSDCVNTAAVERQDLEEIIKLKAV